METLLQESFDVKLPPTLRHGARAPERGISTVADESVGSFGFEGEFESEGSYGRDVAAASGSVGA